VNKYIDKELFEVELDSIFQENFENNLEKHSQRGNKTLMLQSWVTK